MTKDKNLQTVQAELTAAIALPKCQQCGCMAGTLDALTGLLPTLDSALAAGLGKTVSTALATMRPLRYDCLGCEHCYPAVAQNAFARAFPELDPAADLSCDFRVQAENWPPVVGEYFVLDKAAPVAVSTLASVELAAVLARRRPAGLAIVGKTETENIGLDKIVKNTISNPSLRFLIVAGRESQGHRAGQALLALAEQGIDEQGRVPGASGKRPVLRNVTPADVRSFSKQVQVVDMIGCQDPDQISAAIADLARQAPTACGCSDCCGSSLHPDSTQPNLIATGPDREIPLDKAGYFVIVPLADKGLINVEHYAYDNALLRVIEGETARALYHTIIAGGWVSELSHAAYLGKELAKAELALRHGIPYVQDGA